MKLRVGSSRRSALASQQDMNQRTQQMPGLQLHNSLSLGPFNGNNGAIWLLAACMKSTIPLAFMNLHLSNMIRKEWYIERIHVSLGHSRESWLNNNQLSSGSQNKVNEKTSASIRFNTQDKVKQGAAERNDLAKGNMEATDAARPRAGFPTKNSVAKSCPRKRVTSQTSATKYNGPRCSVPSTLILS